jgi:hypothetical protein
MKRNRETLLNVLGARGDSGSPIHMIAVATIRIAKTAATIGVTVVESAPMRLCR